jgi:hypothetical protein
MGNFLYFLKHVLLTTANLFSLLVLPANFTFLAAASNRMFAGLVFLLQIRTVQGCTSPILAAYSCPIWEVFL